jgi:amino acid adenylation domain-containing protein
MVCEETEFGVQGFLYYPQELYSDSMMAHFAKHYQILLEELIANPQGPISHISFLSDAECHKQLIDWNNTATAYPREQSLPALLDAQVADRPEAVAVVCGKEQLTYAQLNQRANQLAHHLRNLGVKPDMLIGLYMERSIETIVGLLGILKAGGAYVPLDPAHPAARLAFVLEDAHVPLILTQASLRDGLPETTAEVVCMDAESSTLSRLSTENPANGVKGEDLAYVIYTSGSTGEPKGVMIQHDSIAEHCQVVQSHYQMEPSDRVLQFASLNFDASLEQIFSTLTSGARLVLCESKLWTIAEFCDQLVKNEITVINLPPAYWQQWLTEWTNFPEFARTNALRLVIIGGDVMSPEVVRAWQHTPFHSIRLINAYGPTETTITASTFDVAFQLDGPQYHQRIPIGRPLANKTVYILDAYQNPMPVGVLGELYIGGAGVARGYLNRPELTAERFIPDPYTTQPGQRLYQSGDVGRYLPTGQIQYQGRRDGQVKIRGFRIELGEIEAALSQYPTLQATVVLCREDDPGEKQWVA